MRHGENALEVINWVKAKIRQLEPGLPEGVRIVPIYDRSDLIRRSIANLRSTLMEVIITLVLRWRPAKRPGPTLTATRPTVNRSCLK